jgi:hypothetical protein
MSNTSKVLDYVEQPNALTCQSACIAKVLGTRDVQGIRHALESMGAPGDPAVMGQYLKSRVQSYKFLSTGSLIDAKEALDEGFVIITHGWFTRSGHVISLVGHEPDPKTLSYRFIVDDPWAEFSFPTAHYTPKSGNNIRYSSYGMYAYCVASSSYENAAALYSKGVLLSSEKGAWLHVVKN